MERPEPAVGQVWRDEDGQLFVVSNCRDDKTASVFYEDLWAVWDLPIHRAVEQSDTYVGQFDGFKVKETK
jgi:hypothetical protein